MNEIKEWVKVSHTANGVTTVTVTLVDGSHTAKWSVKCYASSIKTGVVEGRAGAYRALADLKEALAEMEAAA